MGFVRLVVDTDMGPACDDAGALGLLHILARRGGAALEAVTHCTSSPFGCGCIDAINRAFGMPDVPIGTLKEGGFLAGEEYERFNRFIARRYPNRFGLNVVPPDAQTVLRDALQGAGDGSVTFVALGPMKNLAAFLKTDAELIARKVCRIVATAGCFRADQVPYSEWNISMDVPSAQAVLMQWPAEIVLLPFEAAAHILTGIHWGGMPRENPVRMAYTLDSPHGRASWDLLTVWYAIAGAEPFLSLSPAGDLNVDDVGHTTFTQRPGGRTRILMPDMDPDEIARAIDALWEA